MQASRKKAAQTFANRLNAHKESSAANFSPVGDGLSFGDPFYGGTTDGVLIESLVPLVSQSPLLRRLSDCTLEAGISDTNTFQTSQRIERYEDRLHQVALLTTPVDVYPNGCTDPVTGVPSQPGVVYGKDSGGNFYAAVAEPDATTLQYTNQLTLVHTQGNPVSSQASLMTTVTLDPNSAVTVEGDLVVGDLNGDKNLDIVVPLLDRSNGSGGTSTNNALAILLNTGNGAVGTPTYLSLNVFPVSVTLADLNKDGFLDIIVIGDPATAGGQQGMEIFLGKGDGTFQQAIEGPMGFPSVDASTSQLPLDSLVHVIARDFNGDGNVDIIASTGDILLGKGDGTFTVAPTTLGIVGNAGNGITTADFNHDGKPDLAVAVYPGTINIFFGNGDGSFRPGNVYAAPYNSTDLTASEIDGDGNFDIVVGVCSGGLYLPDGLSTLSGYFLLGRSDGTFAGPLAYQPSAADLAAGDAQVSGAGVLVGDVTGDGKPDLVSFESGNGHWFAVTRPYNGLSDGDVLYGAQIDSAPTFALPSGGTVSLSDVDGDGKPDLVYLTNELSDSGADLVTLHGNGDGTFGSEKDTSLSNTTSYDAGSVFESMVVGQFNADTKPDAIFIGHDVNDSNSTLEFAPGNGDGTFAAPVAIDATLITPAYLIAADFNGDGKLDLVVADAGTPNSDFDFPNPIIKIYIGNGDGTFKTPVVFTLDVNQYGSADGEIGLAVADLRGNGHLDIVAGGDEQSGPNTDELNPYEGFYQVFLGNGDGTFQKQTVVTPAVGLNGQIVSADINRDGKVDLLVSLDTDLILFEGNGDGTLGSPSLIQVPGEPDEIALADLNGDGYPDLVTIGGGISPALNVPAVPLLGTTIDTSTALTSSASQAAPGASITFTATVTPASGTKVPTGTVGFFDGGTELGTGTLNGSGVATYTTTALALGTHSIVATYNGDASFTISSSDTLTITISNTTVPTTTLSPTSLTFSSQGLNTQSSAQSITLSDTNATALTISSISFTGANAGDFAQTNTCGSGIAGNTSCTISVTFKPSASGSRSATLSIADNASGSPQTVALTGTGAAATTTVTVAPTSLTFASQTLNTTSTAQTATITNTGSGAVTISSIAATGTNAGDFSVSNNCNGSVAVSSMCTVSVTFKPTASGARSAAVTITDNATGSPQTITLTGTGAAAATTISVSPTSLTFASQALNTTSTAQTATITNTGSGAVTISSIAATGTNAGDFSVSNNCNGSVAVSSMCTVSVTFKPTAPGARSASVTITDNATGSPQSITLSGTGAAAGTPTASLSPTTLAFASQAINTASVAQTVNLSNSSNSALTISGITFTGANASDFSETDTCGKGVAATSQCTISVVFKPAASGARSATLSVADDAKSSPQTVTITGTGGPAATPTATLSPTTLTFASQLVGSASTSQTITVTNSSSAALTVSGITFTGANASDFTETDNCVKGVAANSTCSISVTFKPGATGARTATLSIADNATGSPQTAGLSGNGIDYSDTAAPTGATTATVAPGGTATYSLEASMLGGLPTDKLSVTVSCASSTATITCSGPASAVSVTGSTPGVFTITATTDAPTSTTKQEAAIPGTTGTPQPPVKVVIFAMGCLVVILGTALFRGASEMRLVLPLAGVAILIAMIAVGCAGNGSGGGSSTGGTAPGSYTLTVTTTSGTVTHTLPLTLTVTQPPKQ